MLLANPDRVGTSKTVLHVLSVWHVSRQCQSAMQSAVEEFSHLSYADSIKEDVPCVGRDDRRVVGTT